MSDNIYQLFRHIKAVAMDVDGVLTDGSLLCTDNGEWLRAMNIKDGYAIAQAVKHGLHLATVSGSHGNGVRLRLERLKVPHVFENVEDKALQLRDWMQTISVQSHEVMYIGDDIPDIVALKLVGLPCCPSDAVSEVLDACKYVSPFGGGKGCVRDVIEKVLKLQERWHG